MSSPEGSESARWKFAAATCPMPPASRSTRVDSRRPVRIWRSTASAMAAKPSTNTTMLCVLVVTRRSRTASAVTSSRSASVVWACARWGAI